MKLYDYLGITPDQFQAYIDDGRVNASHHDEFPLTIFSYGRSTVHDNAWDEVTCKCRGLIVNDETEEIIARPFEKFFNFGQQVDLNGYDEKEYLALPNFHVENKLDGFLGILYEYNGQQYIASKGSFHSPHAKWATAWYHKRKHWFWPAGYTPVFEGICPSLRIVVDYDKMEGLVLLAMINNGTGEELPREFLQMCARMNGVQLVEEFPMHWSTAVAHSNQPSKNVEGFVIRWDRPGKTPFRLKVKFIEYLRLHRFVTGVTPKHILEILQNGWSHEMQELTENSTPWFKKYVLKWKTALEARHDELKHSADMAYGVIEGVLRKQMLDTGRIPTRKDWALLVKRPEFVASAPLLFAMLDGKDVKPIIWKLVKPMTRGAHPLVDAHA